MELNALTAGITRDGLKNRTDIKILVCGLLAKTSRPLTKSDIINIVCGKSLVNYFELCGAVADLDEGGNIASDDGGAYSVTDIGRICAAEMWDSLPLTVREKALDSMQRYNSRRRNEEDNTFTVEPLDSGCRVRCAVKNGDEELMEVALYLPSMDYAGIAREQFFSNPGYLYRIVLAQLTGESAFIDNGGEYTQQ